MKWNQAAPDKTFREVPQGFDMAMERAFSQIHAKERSANVPCRNARRLSFGMILLLIALLAAIATAATLLRHDLFELTTGSLPNDGASILQYNLAQQSFEACDLTVHEAAYDGISLYVVYGIRERSADAPLGDQRGDGLPYQSGERTPAMERDDIGWWCDHLWIDGKCVDVPPMSGSVTICSDTPGELLTYWTFRLDQAKLQLDGENVEIALPIGKRQSRDTLIVDPKTGAIQKPSQGLVIFRLNCSIGKQIAYESPNIELDLFNFTARVSKTAYTPIQMYVTIDAQVKPEAMEAYILEHGEGFVDKDEKLLLSYTERDLVRPWAEGLLLVDEAGNVVVDSMDSFYGYQGMDEKQIGYTFPYLESYPDQMYLAPLSADGETVDMTEAVRVK